MMSPPLPAGVPLVWVLASPHAGDNRQLTALAEALGWPFEVKPFAYRWLEGLVRLAARPSLAGLAAPSRRAVAPPWPDLVIAAGRPTEAVAFWIRAHGNPRAKLVYAGTPWAAPGRFDLVIATPQYRLPDAANVLHIPLPLHDVAPQTLTAAAALWAPRLAHLPRPLTAVLAGGSSGPYVFTAAAATRLGSYASAIAAADGGALLISTSARTPAAAADALFAAIGVPHHRHAYGAEAADNPYLAYLALADRIIVTADSVSMISEAIATGKPVQLFDIEDGRRAMRARQLHWRGRDLSSTAFRLAMRHAPPRWSRDLRIVHGRVTAAGEASWTGDAWPARPPPVRQDLDRSVRRIRSLFEEVPR